MSRSLRVACVAGSLAFHGVVGLFCAAIVPMPKRAPPAIAGKLVPVIAAKADEAARPVLAQRARRELVRHARELRDKGDLRLGAFILAANAIDAAEEGALFDLPRASELYQERLAEMKKALRRAKPEEAVPAVFDDLSYTGLPGGRMGDTLVTQSGSCEPLSHLVVATLYDAGHREVRFRYYGGASAGVTHLAPVIDTKDGERDLVAGGPSTPGGETFSADGLVDAYARAHGIDDLPVARAEGAANPTAAGGRGGGRGTGGDGGLYAGFATPTRSMTAGYPDNGDKFTGALPLYAGRAVSPPAGPGEKTDEPPALPDYSNNCAFLVKPGELDPPRATAILGDDTALVDLYRSPSDEELDRISSFVAELEDAKTKAKAASDREQRVVLDGCLAALYGRASVEFSLAGQPAVASRAALEADAARRDGEGAIDELALAADGSDAALARVASRFGSGAWVMLFLPKGDQVVERLARTSSRDTFDGVTFLTALLVDPETREWALREVDGMPIDRQIEVMHELAHAHDNARPWSAAYELDAPDGSTYESGFLRAYRVFLPMSWRLWEAALPVGDTLDALDAEAKAAKIDDPTTRALIGYYVRNAIWIYAKRASGGEVMYRLDSWLRGHGYGPLVQFDEMKPTPVDIRHIEESLASYAALHKE